MQILNCGDVILLRNITFQDGQYDIKEGHPGIVILPTDENDEEAICLYMTSSKNRSKDKGYMHCNTRVKKNSFVNLKQIVKNPNVKLLPLATMPNSTIYNILGRFSEYQKDNPDENFEKVKNKIDIMLQLFKMNSRLGILRESTIDVKELKMLEQIGNIPMMHMAYLINSNMIELPQIPSDILTNKDRILLGKLQSLYEEVRREKIENLNLEKNSRLRKMYEKTKKENYLINVDILFEKLIDMMQVLNVDKRKINIVNALIQSEKDAKERMVQQSKKSKK